MSIADYSSRAHLINLLRNLDNLKSLAQTGDSVAASIYVDLTTVLSCGVLTEIQHKSIIAHYINRDALRDIAADFERNYDTIWKNINLGLKKISHALETGLHMQSGGRRRVTKRTRKSR
jgi:predicted DNA-binding protein YlxM (UPF0122 family)